MEVLYVLPSVFMGRGKIAIEYRLHKKKLDRRTRFYKRNKNHIVTDMNVAKELFDRKDFGIKLKGNRVILPDGKTAFCFHKAMSNAYEQI